MLPNHDAVVRAITERASLLTGYPYENIEPLQLVRYTDGQRYEPHFDYGEACDFEENLSHGHRHVTMLVYLNSVPEAHGGHTSFPKLNLRLQPLAHAAIVFNDCLPNGEEDPRTLHGGTPPTNHTKIAINIWIRVRARGDVVAHTLVARELLLHAPNASSCMQAPPNGSPRVSTCPCATAGTCEGGPPWSGGPARRHD